MFSHISFGDPFMIKLMSPEGTLVVVGTVFPFTVHIATKVWTRESIHSKGYQLGFCVWIALTATTIYMVIVPRMRIRATWTFRSM
jgi:apolipoprotein N-acyltransferase